MKKTVINLACLILGVLLSLNANSEKNIYERGSGTTGNTKSISAGCVPATGSTELDLNNVRSLIHTGGDMWWDLQDVAKYEVPKGSGKTALFAGGIWIGGVDVNGQLRSCFVRYRANGVDYWPGPLVASGPEQGSITSDVCEAYDRHYVVTRNEVARFRNYINAKLTNDLTILESEEYEEYTTPTIIEEWPAHGDITAGFDWNLAPFYDADYDNVYNPENGDYPFYDLNGDLPCGTTRELRKPRLYGDQTLWWVYNDRGNVHMESNGASIGMEIRAQAFAFSTNDELNNMTFGNYELINRSTYTLYETYFGVWTDADMGDAFDDYVGTDVSRGLGFLFNGDEVDGTGSGQTYGSQPPAIGVDFFEGPYQDADGKDNMSFWDPATGNINCNRLESTYLKEGSINGLNFEDGIVDNERWGMRRFLYFNNGDCDMCDPDIAIEYYQYLRGFWKDGTPLTYGGNGHVETNPEAEFMFPGKTDPCNWGTKGVDPNYTLNTTLGWTEKAENNPPYDRRFVQSSGPFTLEPGAVNDITVGMVWARATSGGAYASVAEVQRADDKAQKLFENCFKVVDGPDAPELKIIELENQFIFHVYNKKGSNNYKQFPEDYIEKDPFIICPESNTDCDIFYRFEGYQVWQLKDATCSVSDLYDADKSRLVFQCDVENYDENGTAIGRLVNYTWDDDMEANIPQMMVDGKNEGIKHTFVLTDDQFATGDKRLVNHRKYYYIALAYAYNDYKHYSQSDANSIDGQKSPYKAGRKGASGSIKVYEAIPHIVDPAEGGTILNSSYGDGPEIVQLEGHGSGGNRIDLTDETKQRIMAGPPWKVDSIVYKEGSGPINVKVIDPLNVPKAELMLAFDSVLTVYIHRNKIVRGKWKMWQVIDGVDDTNSIIYSDSWISWYELGKRTSPNAEQLIPGFGISVNVNQVDYPLEEDNPYERNGFIDASIEFEDITKPWLNFIPDIDGCSPFDWIRSGEVIEKMCACCDDYMGLDNGEYYETVLDGGWAPYLLTAKDGYRLTAKGEDNTVISTCSKKYGIGYYWGLTTLNEKEHQLHSIDLVITSDKSLWTRSPVIEMCEWDTSGGTGFHASGMAENNTPKFTLRNHPSIGKDGLPDGAVDDSSEAMIGMGWFPGYAIDVQTGRRLNIMYGEDSKWAADNGRDLVWNPSSRWVTDFYYPGSFSDVYAGDIIWGGKHVIYIMGNNRDSATCNSGSSFYCPYYDEGKYIYHKLKKASLTTLNDNPRKQIFANVMWAGIPVLNPEFELLATDLEIKIRVATPYQVGKEDMAVNNPRNSNKPLYRFDLTQYAPIKGDIATAKDALDLIRVVPNPYYGYSEYELSQLDKLVKFTNLPEECTISIYTIGGTLIRQFKKSSSLSYLDWDLKNEYGIEISSGVYIIHINAPGIGEKILKWFGSLRPIDLTNF